MRDFSNVWRILETIQTSSTLEHHRYSSIFTLQKINSDESRTTGSSTQHVANKLLVAIPRRWLDRAKADGVDLIFMWRIHGQ